MSTGIDIVSAKLDIVSKILDTLAAPSYLVGMLLAIRESKMELKQWNAIIELAAQLVITAWLVFNAGQAQTVAAVAAMLLWAGGAMIILTILGAIVVSILVNIARKEGRRGDRADERDRAIYAKSMRNAYFFVSIAC